MNEALALLCPRNTFTRTHQDNIECNYCGGLHYIKNCEHIEEDIKSGKFKKNHEGKVVLPNEFYVSRSIPGKWMCDRIYEWHQKNPTSQATTLVHTIELHLLCAAPSNSATAKETQTIYQLTANDHIAVLEMELFNLRARKPAAAQGPHTRAQKAQEVTIENVEDEADVEEVRAWLRTPWIEEVEELSAPSGQAPQKDPAPAPTSEHPFRNAKNVAYTLPSTMNIGTQNKAPSAPYKCTDPAYRTLPPVHDPAIATSVFQHSMEAPFTITQRELLSLSPEVCSQVRDSTTMHRIPNKEYTISQNFYEDTEGLDSDNLTMTYLVAMFPVSDAYNNPIPNDAL